MGFKCNYEDEYRELNYCENECGNEDCDQYDEIVRKQGNAEKIRSSELKGKIVGTLNKTLGIEGEQSEQIVNNLLSDVIFFTENNIKEATRIVLKEKIDLVFEEKINGKINELFEKALSEEILKIDSNNVSVVKVQADIEKRIINFLNDGYDRRRTLDDSVDKAIGAIANNKVDDVLKEIKTETIDKFNKEVMKKMMVGMAGAISDDKRLLSLLDL